MTLVLTPVAAAAQTAPATPAQVAPTATAPAKPNPADRVICRTEDRLGSRLGGHRECHTKADWDALAKRGATDLDDSIRRNLQQRIGPSGGP